MNESIKRMTEYLAAWQRESGEAISWQTDVSMSLRTSFRIGGIADLFVSPTTVEGLKQAVSAARQFGVKHLILGNGSNLLIDDAGYRGVVIATGSLNRITVSGNEIEAESGASLMAVCVAAREASLTGLEFAYGIPGSVGGALTMNAGAYGGEICQVLAESTAMNPEDGSLVTYLGEQHAFGYRDSVYRHNGQIILSGKFRLTEGNSEEIADKMRDILSRRKEKQPLEYPSAGSVFKRYPGRYTGQMVEECGLKGFAIGGAQVSEKHAGFIINRGGATCEDVLRLIDHIKNEVLEHHGVCLECEVIHVKA